MTGTTDNRVLMKCEKCGYQELVPLTDLELLRSVEKDLSNYEDRLLMPPLFSFVRLDALKFLKYQKN